MSYSKIIYVAGKFQNQPENKIYIEQCCRRFSKEYPKYLFINGVSQFSHYYDCTTQSEGIDMCLKLMERCDEVWTVGEYENSVGTYCEIKVAQALGIEVKEHMDKDSTKTKSEIKDE